jgi:hypothetical protein
LSAFLLFDKPWFLTEGKLAAIFIKTFSWGLPTGWSFYFINKRQQAFWHHHHRAIRGISLRKQCKLLVQTSRLHLSILIKSLLTGIHPNINFFYFHTLGIHGDIEAFTSLRKNQGNLV